MSIGTLLASVGYCDNLVRIRIRGIVPLINGSGSGYIPQWPSRPQQKEIPIYYAYYSLKVSFFKEKSHKEVTKQ